MAEGPSGEGVLEEGREVEMAIEMRDESWEIESEIKERESHRMDEESNG